MSIPTAQRYQAPSTVLAQEVNGEMVLLDLGSEAYFGLNAVGARVWQLLEQGQSEQQMLAVLLDEFDVAPEVLGPDLQALIAQLLERGLVLPAP